MSPEEQREELEKRFTSRAGDILRPAPQQARARLSGLQVRPLHSGVVRRRPGAWRRLGRYRFTDLGLVVVV